MHEVSKEEQEKRGCRYCTKLTRVRGVSDNGNIYTAYTYICPFAKCPYRDLDNFETYDEYLESLGVKFNIED